MIHRQGKANINRITWTPLSDGHVRQHCEIAFDEGSSWSSVFDGIYTQKLADVDDQ